MAQSSDSSGSAPKQVPEQAPQQGSEKISETRLKQGLAALKQKNYEAAIAQLRPLVHDPMVARRLKAQVGLAKAYMGQGNHAAAIARCQPLTQSQNVQVQAWAQKTLARLSASGTTPQTSPDLDLAPPATEATPPSPDGRSAPSNSGFVIVTPPQQSSGFTPLATDSDPVEPIGPATPLASTDASSPASSSGFTPFVELDPAVSAPVDATEPSPPDQAADGYANDQTGRVAGTPPGQSSMFHYSYLNHPTGSASVPDTNPPPASQVMPEERPLPVPSVEPPVESAQSELRQTVASQAEASSTTAEDTLQLPTQLADGTWQWVSTQRLTTPRRLAATQSYKLWGITVFTAIAWFWLLPALLYRTLRAINWLLYRLRWPIDPQPIPAFYRDYHWPIFFVLATLIVASPWLFDYLLSWAYGLKSFSTRGLTPKSAEAVRIIRRVCQQRGWEVPALKTLPTSIPLCFSYGCLPRFARIVVSQGVLDHFSEDEIAALYAYEISHISRWDWPIMSGLGLCLQGFYLGYWRLASWGNDLKPPILRFPLGLLASAFYGVYWLVRKVGLWLSRVRILECDRGAVELTGNPNGLTHALVKLADGVYQSIARLGYTDIRLEGLDLLTPLSPQTVIGLGGLKDPSTWPRILPWDLTNPYRHWLDFNAVNPALGGRLQALTHYAEIWQLKPELGWLSDIDFSLEKKSVRPSSYWQPLLLQGAPYFGPLLGFAIAMTLWFMGGVSEAIGFWQIEWFYQDNTILYGSILMGLGIGTLLRINPFFPDLTAKTSQTNPTIHRLQAAPHPLPVDSVGVRLQGQLLGRPGLANWLGQDLILKTDTGLVKLHFSSELGIPGNTLIAKKRHPVSFIKRHLTVIGWFRRGATGWLDIDRLQVRGQPVIYSPHPIFATLISIGVTLWGIYRIFRGY